uniref:LITAF domain-containing protein n=1 Tax=Trichobilharzia regenti TaxID=157069 RepID=A0AA85JE43_TRIRE|nr:unnamed protein product [Trichobilharzia regenti]
MKHRGGVPIYGPSRSSQASTSRPIRPTTKSECYYCNRFGKRARKCGHNDVSSFKRFSTGSLSTQQNRNVGSSSTQAPLPSAPSQRLAPPPPPTTTTMPTRVASSLSQSSPPFSPPSPPPPYQGPAGYAHPPPTYEESELPQVIVTQPPATIFKWNPVGIVCPYCHNSVVTKTRSEAGLLAWLLCGVLCLMGLWVLCCLIPFYLESTQDVVHICPLCKSQVGYYKPL